MQRGGRGGIRLWALSVNHTALPHRRHLSPNTKGCAPQGTLKPISPLTSNPSRSRKNRIVESYHIHFLCEGTFWGEKTAGTEVVWRDFRVCPCKVLPFFQMTFTFLNWISCFAAALQLLGLLDVMEIWSPASYQLQAPECWSEILSHSCFYWLTYRIDWWALHPTPPPLHPPPPCSWAPCLDFVWCKSGK